MSESADSSADLHDVVSGLGDVESSVQALSTDDVVRALGHVESKLDTVVTDVVAAVENLHRQLHRDIENLHELLKWLFLVLLVGGGIVVLHILRGR